MYSIRGQLSEYMRNLYNSKNSNNVIKIRKLIKQISLQRVYGNGRQVNEKMLNIIIREL